MADNYRGPGSPHLAHRQCSRNPVLLKDDVGRGKPSAVNLPSEHAFGRPEPQSADGVREAMVWTAHSPSAPRGSGEGQNYQRLNKAAARAHVTSAAQLANFRQGKHFPESPAHCRLFPERPAVLPSDVIPSWTYGKQGRPSTPIASVIGNDPGNEAEVAVDDRYRRYDGERAAQQDRRLVFKHTKSERLRAVADKQRREAEAEAEHPSEPWKMSKFKAVPSNFQKEGLKYESCEEVRQRRASEAPARSASLPEVKSGEARVPGRGRAAAELDLADGAFTFSGGDRILTSAMPLKRAAAEAHRKLGAAAEAQEEEDKEEATEDEADTSAAGTAAPTPRGTVLRSPGLAVTPVRMSLKLHHASEQDLQEQLRALAEIVMERLPGCELQLQFVQSPNERKTDRDGSPAQRRAFR